MILAFYVGTGTYEQWSKRFQFKDVPPWVGNTTNLILILILQCSPQILVRVECYCTSK